MEPFSYRAGTLPVILSIPHTATYVPDVILNRFTPAAKLLADTDWHTDKLYSFARDMGVHILTATHSRYVVDLNRDPNNLSLYPGKFTTGLCPLTTFGGDAIYEKGHELQEAEVPERLKTYWQPYHDRLASLIAELKTKHRRVAVFDAHSIRSHLPLLFEGVLPDLNLGTADGATVDQGLADRLEAHAQASAYSHVYNGRFKGGYITRHYGKPVQHVYAVQLELAQKNYMLEHPPFTYDEGKAAQLQTVLKGFLSLLVEWTRM